MASELLLPSRINPAAIRCMREEGSGLSGRCFGDSQKSMELIVSLPFKALRDVGLDRKHRPAKLAYEVVVSAPAGFQGVLDGNGKRPRLLPAAQIFKASHTGHGENCAAGCSEASLRLSENGTEKPEVRLEARFTRHPALHSAPGTQHPDPAPHAALGTRHPAP